MIDIICYHKINEDHEVKGFLDYKMCSEIEEVITYNVYEVLEDNDILNINYTGKDEIEYLCIYAHGSRVYGNPRKKSDIDFVLFYKGSIREDDLFNIFGDESIYIEHIKCDFNPIKIDDESDIEYYIQKHDIEYHQNKSNLLSEKKQNFIHLSLDNFDFNDNIQKQSHGKIKDINITKDNLDLLNNFVDLGLPSGTLWCKYNLGCDFNLLSCDPKKTKAKDWYGDYYAWGEIETKAKSNNIALKYNDDDNLSTLLPKDDIATILCGKYAHIPSKKQFDELFFLDYRYVKYKYVKDLYGIMFKGKNGNELFLPAAGCYNAVGFENVYDCYYWSRDRLKDTKDLAYFYYANNRTASINCGYRSLRLSIRPVYNI